MCTENQPEYFAHLCDFTRSGNETYDVDASIQYCYMWNELPDAGTCTVNIQDGDNQGIFIRGFFQQIFDGIQGIALHAYKNYVGLLVVFLGCAGLYR